MSNLLVKFILGALIYMGIEVLYDNTSDRSMGLVGGIAFVVCSYILTFNLPYLINCFLFANLIMVMEYIAGKIFNKDYKIWDYRKIPFNFQGQICLPFYLIWMAVISPFIMWIDKII